MPVYAYSGNPAMDAPVFYASRRKAQSLLDAGDVKPIMVNGQSVLQKITPDRICSYNPSAITAWESEINAGVRDGNQELIRAKIHSWKPSNMRDSNQMQTMETRRASNGCGGAGTIVLP